MFKMNVIPRFCDTDALGHISNTVLPSWFETARDPVFRLFTPDLDPKKWELIIAKYEIEFLAELFYGHDIVIETTISHIGKSAFHVQQTALQKQVKAVQGTAVLVHFDYQQKKATPIPEHIKQQLQQHLA